MKIREKISVVFISGLIMVVGLFSFITITSSNVELEAQVNKHLETTAALRQREIETFLNNYINRMIDFSSDGFIKNCLNEINIQSGLCDSADLSEHLIKNKITVLENSFEVFNINKDGVLVSSTNPENLGQDKSQNPVFGAALVQPNISDIKFNEDLDTYFYTVSAPVIREGEFVGVVGSHFSAQLLYEILGEKFGFDDIGETFLINKDYLIISPTKNSTENSQLLRTKIKPESASGCFESAKSSEAFMTFDESVINYAGNEVLSLNKQLQNSDWCLLTQFTKSDVNLASKRLSNRLIFASLGSLLVFMFIALWMSTLITKPILNLQKGVEKIKAGNLKHRVGTEAKDEIGELSRIFDELTESVIDSRIDIEQKVREQTTNIFEQKKSLERQQLAIMNILEDVEFEKSLSDQQALDLKKFQLAVENASDLILISDSDGTIIYTNPRLQEMTGYTKEEAIGTKAGQLWGGLMEKSFYEHMWRTIKEEKQTFDSELKNKKKTGEIYESSINISPILDKYGDIKFYVSIERDITKAKNVDRMKTEFISLASHQLRTPLSAMRWFSEMLLSGDAGKLTEQQAEFVTNISDSNDRMIELVNSLLNISRIESGRIIIDPEPTDLKELIENVLKEVEVKIKEKKQKIVLSIHDNLQKVNIDPHLIFEVYKNLITNAIKYSPPESEITIFISEKGPNVISQVSDNGYGIPEKDINHIFNKFFRADNILEYETDGNGLGLYLTKSIIESSGGKIWFTSTEGKGTSFFFSLPKKGVPKQEGDVTLS